VSLSIGDFWKLLNQSRLLTSQQVEQVSADFAAAAKGQDATSVKALGEWLLAKNVLSRYQITTLLAGKSGPFFFGDYKIFDRLDKGRLKGHFRAVHSATGHPVMLQFLTGPLLNDPQLWAATSQYVMALYGIASPHVQRFMELVDLKKFKFVVGEDLRGKTLDEAIKGGGAPQIPPTEACRIVRFAALGLAPLHQAGITHGNVRPGNVFLEPVPQRSANVKLLLEAQQPPAPIDFSQQEAGSRAALMADYLAPELAAPGRLPDPLSDIYALGCTLFYLLMGSPPFAGGNIQHKMSRHATEAIRPLESIGLPQPLTQVVAYMMAKNATVRYQSAALVAEQLAAFVEPQTLYVQLPAPPATLAGYEQYLQEKRAKLATPPSATPLPSATPPPEPAISSTPFPHLTPSGSSPGVVIGNVAGPTPPAVPPPPVARRPSSTDEILRRRKAGQRRNLMIGLTSTAILLIALAGGGIWWWHHLGGMKAIAGLNNSGESNESPQVNEPPVSEHDQSEPVSTTSSKVRTDAPPSSSTGSGEGGLQVVSDDGNLLWASPTAGKPFTFHGVPPEAQVFLIVRPADMLSKPEGQRVLAALGPTFAAERQAWETASGVKLDEIDQLIVTLHGNQGKSPRVHFVVKTKAPISKDDLLARWGNPSASEEKSQTYYTRDVRAYYIPPAGGDAPTFTMGDPRDVKEVAAASAAPPVVFRDIERLRRYSDADRHLTLFFYPQFLFSDDGRPLFAGDRGKLQQPLTWLLGADLQAASASLHCGDDFYFEMRMLSSLDKNPQQLAEEFRARLSQVPTAIESYIDRLAPPPYWSRLARRYPLMISQLHQQMRVSTENDQAIVNAVLPGTAAHNLVLGGELLVATPPGAAPVVSTASAVPAAGPKTIEDALQLKTTYTFAQLSLEVAMRDLAEDVKGNTKGAPFEFAIKILGDDLKLEGITRNQSIRDFNQDNQTVADILTALVRKANPVTTVKDPSETDQKLVWLIGPDPDNPGKKIILITTRTAANTKKFTLPAPFVAKK
jgi:serine/threonine protein kinase